MITVETLDGNFVKNFHLGTKDSIGLHQLFGFVSEDQAGKRIETRKRNGFEFNNNKWHCRFKVEQSDKGPIFSNFEDCKVLKGNKGTWKLYTPLGEFNLTNTGSQLKEDLLTLEEDKASWVNRFTEIILLAIFILIPILYFSAPEEVVEEKKEKVLEKITVKVVERAKAVNISQNKANIKVKPLTEKQKSKRAVQRDLGFLGLVGSKDLTKATGGLPTKLKKVTAGAGKGGDAGSGGEVLTGLGKGLKKVTVGNTGVAGLGGIGTKGAGGGAGGYGNTRVASGSGKGVSSIAVSSSDMVLEGGLSRYAINATIAKYLSQVRRCYENQLNIQPGLEGLVTVSFQINGKGMLNYSRVKSSSLNSKTVEKCITQKMMTWKFPLPKGGVNVNINYPFMLRPVGT